MSKLHQLAIASISTIFAGTFLGSIRILTTYSLWSSEGEYDTANPIEASFRRKQRNASYLGIRQLHAKFLKSDLKILKMADGKIYGPTEKRSYKYISRFDERRLRGTYIRMVAHSNSSSHEPPKIT